MLGRWRLALVVAVLGTALGVLTLAPSSAAAAGINLHRGSHGKAVKVLETRLARLWLLPRSAVDRRYRPATVRAVRHYQRMMGRGVTGRVDASTWRAIAYERARRARTRWPSVLGHRGAATAGLAENTLQSLRYAAPWSDVLEFDLRMTSDHQLVLMHDVTLDRTTNCSGPVSSWSLAALQQMCRVGDQPIPTFDEAVRYAASVGKPIAPELKPASMDRSDLQQFLATLAAHDMTARSWVQSYYGSRLEALRQLAPGLRTVLVSAGAPPVASVRAVHPDAVAASLAALTLPAVSAYHRAGVRVWGWTARDVAALETAHALDCDSVVTDIPRTARLRYR